MNVADVAANGPYDLAIIGGGINGCGLAAEAARYGLKVALFEQSDFGFGTTWRSTKLVHGGLRYLEHGELGLVFESLRERATLLRERPHLVEPQRFIFPVLPWTRRPGWQIRAGLTLYDLLAFRGGLPRHRSLRAGNVRDRMPWLPGSLDGAFGYYDARLLAPERLALELALEARDHGAAIANHARVTDIEGASGRVAALRVEQDGQIHEVAARVAVNAAGPWVDAFNEEATPGREPELLTLTRGSHLVVRPPVDLPSIALISTARSDGRVFFAVPQDGLLLIGTTDDRYEGDPGDVRPTAEDIAYLLDEAEALLPGLRIGVDDICYTYAGVRPLRREPGNDESAITRTHAIVSHGESGGLQELYSLVGGKLSTYRPLARTFLREVYDLRRPVDGDETRPPSAMMPDDLLLAEGLPDQARRLLRRYGPAASSVVALGLEVIHGESGLTDGMVRHAARREEASTLADIVMRRTGLCWAADRGESAWERVADIAAEELGWDDAAREAQIAELRHEVAFNLPKPGEPWLPLPA